jgi:hypothetical protein
MSLINVWRWLIRRGERRFDEKIYFGICGIDPGGVASGRFRRDPKLRS